MAIWEAGKKIKRNEKWQWHVLAACYLTQSAASQSETSNELTAAKFSNGTKDGRVAAQGDVVVSLITSFEMWIQWTKSPRWDFGVEFIEKFDEAEPCGRFSFRRGVAGVLWISGRHVDSASRASWVTGAGCLALLGRGRKYQRSKTTFSNELGLISFNFLICLLFFKLFFKFLNLLKLKLFLIFLFFFIFIF